MTHHIHIRIATFLTYLLEEQFHIGKFRFGLDPVLGLFPGFGDLVSLILSFYIVGIAYLIRLPNDKIGTMIKNIILDFMIGIVPIVGDIADVVYKANSKNLRILDDHLKKVVVEGEIV